MEQTAQVVQTAMTSFNFLSAFLKQILDVIVSVVGNYGWSVVIFTILVRLVVLPLDIQSKKSMKRMSTVQPKIAALQKKYAKDKDKLNQKTQELYKQEGINPLSGCLPMLIQMPILFCMFSAMRVVANEHTVTMLMDLDAGKEVVLQNWLWIKNVFQPDSFMSTVIPAIGSKLQEIQGIPGSSILTLDNIDAVKRFLTTPEYAAIAQRFGADMSQAVYHTKLLNMMDITIPLQFNGLFILPIVAAASQFFSAKLLQPAQAQAAETNQQQSTNQMMTWMMPIMSLFFCASYSGAFALYWVAGNIIMIVQQYALNLYFDHIEKKKVKTEEVVEP